MLKCQRYVYRARHLARGGAEEVRLECRHGWASEPQRLVLGGAAALQRLRPAHRSTVEALLAWLQSHLRAKKRSFVDLLKELPRATRRRVA